jgi:hypothetical protein
MYFQPKLSNLLGQGQVQPFISLVSKVIFTMRIVTMQRGMIDLRNCFLEALLNCSNLNGFSFNLNLPHTTTHRHLVSIMYLDKERKKGIMEENKKTETVIYCLLLFAIEPQIQHLLLIINTKDLSHF